MIWDEASIREEMKKLDAITGCRGAELPIRFSGRAFRMLACYYGGEDDKGGSFMFADRYFKDPEFPREDALNVIRHEYAHYLDDIRHGEGGHGKTWKSCCMEVGADPIMYYRKENAVYHRKLHEEEAELSEYFDLYQVGMKIRHPVFGVGTIKEIIGIGTEREVKVLFPAGEKRLGLRWIDEKCKLLS